MSLNGSLVRDSGNHFVKDVDTKIYNVCILWCMRLYGYMLGTMNGLGMQHAVRFCSSHQTKKKERNVQGLWKELVLLPAVTCEFKTLGFAIHYLYMRFFIFFK